MTIFDQKWPFFGTPPGGGVFDTFWHVTIVQIVQIVHNVCAYTRFRVYTQCVSQKCFCESQYFIKSFYFIKYFFLTRKKMPLLFGSLFFCSFKKNEHSTLTNFRLATFSASIANFSCVVFERPKFGKSPNYAILWDFTKYRFLTPKTRGSPQKWSFLVKNGKFGHFRGFRLTEYRWFFDFDENRKFERKRRILDFLKREKTPWSDRFTSRFTQNIGENIVFSYIPKPTARGNDLFGRF